MYDIDITYDASDIHLPNWVNFIWFMEDRCSYAAVCKSKHEQKSFVLL